MARQEDEETKRDSQADGEGEAVLDEPTAHAMDPEADPNNEWEERAHDQLEDGNEGDPTDH